MPSPPLLMSASQAFHAAILATGRKQTVIEFCVCINEAIAAGDFNVEIHAYDDIASLEAFFTYLGYGIKQQSYNTYRISWSDPSEAPINSMQTSERE